MLRACILLLFTGFVSSSLAETFTPREQAWIASHPRVYYTVDNLWPQESVEGSKHTGLSREVLDEVTRRTGIQFIYVPPNQTSQHRPMMVSALTGNLLTDEQRQRWLLTFPWINTMPIIVAKKDQVQLRTLAQMQGKQIAVAADSEFAPWIRRHYPAIHVVIKSDVRSALQSVETGENVAAIASGLVILPILQRHYINQLGIVAQIPEMVSGVNMGVDPAYPELRDILNNVMANISARDAERLFAHWVSVVDIGTPTLQFVVWQYRYPLAVISILVLLLILAMRFALQSRKRAIRSEQHKSHFLAVMSHEVRTPMNAIIASLELLQQSDSSSTKRHQYIDLAYSSSQDLLDLLNNVLDHEKISQNKVAIKSDPVAIGTLLEAVIDSQRPAAQRKGIMLSFEDYRSNTTEWVQTDAHRLRQIINNLLSNAIKFTDSGSVLLRLENRDELLCFTVRDSGVGIAPALKKTLMKAWQQGDHQAGGSGLGLYICHSLVTQMGGTVEIKSQPGKGTDVRIILPLKSIPPVVDYENTSNLSLPHFGENCSVLLVEDHFANRELIAEQLTQLACHFEIAEDGESAIQLFEDENYYDVVLLDCGLPGIDGYAAARQIRLIEQHQRRERTPIIAISALHSPSHQAKCHESGMDGVLSKPIRISELAEELKKWCPYEALQTSVEHSAATVSDEVWLALQQDADAFMTAARQRQMRYMIHHIHRIKGVALMYHLQGLAEFSAELESSLRADIPSEHWTLDQWHEQLNTLCSPSNLF
ncbi:ATP-binding protein [Pantoea dispersa]|uniref:ATP-binding protein n=1 Tax=Pantoea dispersa TaxID=59814 RepID=UPI001331B141|nr:ATP-binding protein [Pantoea dispersa]